MAVSTIVFWTMMGVGYYLQRDYIETEALNQIREAQRDFIIVERQDTKILLAALDTFIKDESFKEIYLEKDRKALYNYGQPLFEELKNGSGIT